MAITRAQLNADMASTLVALVDIPDHLTVNHMILDYLDQQIGTVTGDTWTYDKSNYYTKQQVTNLIAAGSTELNISDINGLQLALDQRSLTGHTHAAGDVISGVFNPARLGTGTANGTTLLYGDGTWKVAPVDTHFANTNLTLNANRTHQLGNYSLMLESGGTYFDFNKGYMDLNVENASGTNAAWAYLSDSSWELYSKQGSSGKIAELESYMSADYTQIKSYASIDADNYTTIFQSATTSPKGEYIALTARGTDSGVATEGVAKVAQTGVSLEVKDSSVGVWKTLQVLNDTPANSGKVKIDTLNDGSGVAKMVTVTNGVLGYDAIPSAGSFYTFQNGLTATGTTVKLGGTFNESISLTGSGNPTSFSLTNFSTGAITSNCSIGGVDYNAGLIWDTGEQGMFLKYEQGTDAFSQIQLSNDAMYIMAGNNNTGVGGGIAMNELGLSLNHTTGSIIIPALNTGTTDNVLYYDSTAGGVTWGAAPADTHFANTDLTFTGNRKHDGDGNYLWLDNLSGFYATAKDSGFTTELTLQSNFELAMVHDASGIRRNAFYWNGTRMEFENQYGTYWFVNVPTVTGSTGHDVVCMDYNGELYKVPQSEFGSGGTGGGSLSGTQYKIPFFDTSSSVGSTSLHWDTANSQLVVVTSSAQAPFKISGTSGHNPQFRIENDSGVVAKLQVLGSNALFGTESNHPMEVRTNNQVAAVFTNTQKLLLGGITDQGSYNLQVGGNAFFKHSSTPLTLSGDEAAGINFKDFYGRTGTVKYEGDKFKFVKNGASAASVEVGEDIEVTDSTKGIIMKSPNGTRWRITIDNNGALTSTAL